MRQFFLVFICILLFGCNEKGDKQKPKEEAIKHPGLLKSIIKKDTLLKNETPGDTIPKIQVPAGTIQIITDDHIDTPNRIRILQVTFLNKDEIDPTIKKLNWKGLFFGKKGAYINDAKIKIIPAQSEGDEEGQKTGWSVEKIYKDYVYYITGVDSLKDGPVKQSHISVGRLFPGEKKEFNYNSTIYTFYATGYKKGFIISNYKLFIMATIKGHSFNQLLFATALFGTQDNSELEENVTIEFVGDIDGDQIPDLILSKSGNFWGSTDLYLSKPAGNKAVLKHVTD